MKILFKSKLTISIIAICGILLLSSFLNQQAKGNKYLLMRVFEMPKGHPFDSKIIVVYEDGRTEEIQLERSKADNTVIVAKKINETINTIAERGYELVTITSNGGQSYTYNFVKR